MSAIPTATCSYTSNTGHKAGLVTGTLSSIKKQIDLRRLQVRGMPATPIKSVIYEPKSSTSIGLWETKAVSVFSFPFELTQVTILLRALAMH